MIRSFFSLLFLFSFLFSLQAAPMYAGGQITYQHKGSGVYDIFLSVVYDCSGDSTQAKSLTFYRLGTGFSGSFTVGSGSKVSENDVTGYSDSCKGMSPCAGGSGQIGYKKVVYKFTYDLSQDTACNFRIYWSDQNYSSKVTTGYAGQLFEIEALLDRCDIEHNSPEFIGEFTPNLEYRADTRLVYTCKSSSTDSLAYSLEYPTGKYVFNPTWSNTRPLDFFGFPNANLSPPAGFHFNNGIIQFRPYGLNQIAVVCVNVEQWRKVNNVMTKIGTVRRDMLVDVGSRRVNNLPPYFDINFPVTKSVCDNDTQLMLISSHDNNAGEYTKITVLNADSNLIVQVIDTGQYELLTVRLRSGIQVTYPKLVNCYVLLEDNACPFSSSIIREFRFSIVPHVEGETHISGDTLCGRMSFSVKSAKDILFTTWTLTPQDTLQKKISTNDTFAELGPGVWASKITLYGYGSCKLEYWDTIHIQAYVHPTFQVHDTAFCKHETWLIDIGLFGQGTVNYEWTDAAGTFTDTTGLFNYTATSSESIFLKTTDQLGCSFYDTIDMLVHELPVFQVSPDTSLCNAVSLQISASPDSLLSFLWSTGDTTANISISATGNYLVAATDSNSCVSHDSVSVVFNTIQAVNLGPDRLLCYNDTYSILLASYDSIFWSDGQVNKRYWQMPDTGFYWVTAKNNSGCAVSDSIHLGAQVYNPFVLADQTICLGDSVFVSVPGYSNYWWMDGLASSSRWLSTSGKYSLITFDGNCSYTDDFLVTQSQVVAEITGFSRACAGTTAKLYAYPGYSKYLWNTGDTSDFILTDTSGWYWVSIENSDGCTGSDSFLYYSIPMPDPSFTFVQTNQNSVVFLANDSAGAYAWYLGDGTYSSSRQVNHLYQQPGKYRVTLIVGDTIRGCWDSSYQEVTVLLGISNLVNNRLKLYPNPNGGKFTILWEGQPCDVLVYDYLGKQVGQIHLEAGENSVTLDLPKGVYMLMDEKNRFRPVRFQISPF